MFAALRPRWAERLVPLGEVRVSRRRCGAPRHRFVIVAAPALHRGAEATPRGWCPGGESNPHSLNGNMDLNHARLPIPPPGPVRSENHTEAPRPGQRRPPRNLTRRDGPRARPNRLPRWPRSPRSTAASRRTRRPTTPSRSSRSSCAASSCAGRRSRACGPVTARSARPTVGSRAASSGCKGRRSTYLHRALFRARCGTEGACDRRGRGR